jgi:hypothetical protein
VIQARTKTWLNNEKFNVPIKNSTIYTKLAMSINVLKQLVKQHGVEISPEGFALHAQVKSELNSRFYGVILIVFLYYANLNYSRA